MKVISGTARGKNLETLDGLATRPTIARVKEGIFSSVQFLIPGAAVLDLFAGSGQMGIEALSRGAKTAYFVDNSKKSLDTVKRNLKTTKLEQNAKTFAMDYQSFLAMCSECFDIAFLDPPYKTGILQNSLELVPEIMNETGVIIAENPLDEEILSNYGNFVLDRQYRYGKIKISTFRHKDFVQ